MAIKETTTVSLRVMLIVLLFVAAGAGAWADIRWQVKDLAKDRWTVMDDTLYMQRYSTLNELKMLGHVDP